MNNYFRLLLQNTNVEKGYKKKKDDLYGGRKLVHSGWSTDILYSKIIR